MAFFCSLELPEQTLSNSIRLDQLSIFVGDDVASSFGAANVVADDNTDDDADDDDDDNDVDSFIID